MECYARMRPLHLVSNSVQLTLVIKWEVVPPYSIMLHMYLTHMTMRRLQGLEPQGFVE